MAERYLYLISLQKEQKCNLDQSVEAQGRPPPVDETYPLQEVNLLIHTRFEQNGQYSAPFVLFGKLRVSLELVCTKR